MSEKLNGEKLISGYLRKLAIIGRTPETIRAYRIELRRIFKYIKDYEMIQELAQLDRYVIERYQVALRNRKKRIGDKCYYSNALVLRMFFEWLEEENNLQNLSRYVQIPRRPEEKIPDFFSEEEVRKILEVVETKSKLGVRDKAILELLYGIGVRSGEIEHIKVDDVLFEERTIVIRKSKGQRYYVLPLGEIALKSLKHYLKEKRHLFMNAENLSWFFLNLKGTPMKGRNVTAVVKKYAKLAGIERRAYAHMIRHSMATHMIRRYAPIRHVQQLLGHKRLDSTMLYTHLSPEDLREAHTKFHPRNHWPSAQKLRKAS